MLHLTKDEQEYMNNNCRFIPPVYWEWLSSFKFNSGKIQASLDENNHLHIKVTDYLYKVTLYEVPILAIVSELRSRIFDNNCDLADVIKRLSPKIKLSNVAGIKFSEFGTRRRFSYNVQDIVVSAIKEGSIYCTGTSNCHLAMKYDMPMMGTHPHEWFMFHGAMYGYRQANYMALENWVNVYDGDPEESNRQNVTMRFMAIVPEDSIGISTNAIKGQLGGEENEVKAIMWIKMSNLDDYQWAFGHDKLIKGLYTLIPDIRNLLEN